MFSARHLSVLVLACSLGALSAQPTQTITEIVVASASHSTLETLVVRAGLDGTLGGGSFTLFAPTNTAFDNLGSSTLVSKLTGGNARWTPLLADTLKYHALTTPNGNFSSSSLPVTPALVDTVAPGWQVSIKNTSPQVTATNTSGVADATLGAATVTVPDNYATNGVVHIVDAVLLPPSTQRTVVDIATGSTTFSTLVSLLGQASLVTALQTDEVQTSFTVFAPTNDAFGALDAATVACLQADGNEPLLESVLRLHVANATVVASGLPAVGSPITSISTSRKNTITYSAANTLTSGGQTASITGTDNLANNGVVHVINRVLLPMYFRCPATIINVVADSAAHATLESLLVTANLITILQGNGTFTLFAPTDAAFTALGQSTLVSKLTGGNPRWTPLLADTLKYHVLSGQTLSTALPATATNVDTLAGTTGAMSQVSVKAAAPEVAGAGGGAGTGTVTTADIRRGNGVVHVINGVLLPPSTQRTVVDIATANAGTFSTLTGLLTTANLVTTLNTDSVDTSYTVFAPTNTAFAKLASATLDCLGEEANRALLTNLLRYHVVAGTVMSSDLTNGQTITSIATGTNSYTFASSGLTLSPGSPSSPAALTGLNNLAVNGVVHIIDTVLIPSDFSCTPSGDSAASSARASLVTVFLGLIASALALVF